MADDGSTGRGDRPAQRGPDQGPQGPNGSPRQRPRPRQGPSQGPTQRPSQGPSRGPNQGTGQEPGLRPTKPLTLAVSAVTAGALAWLAMHNFLGRIPDLTWLPGLTMAGLAAVEAVAAASTRAKVERRPRSGILNPLLVARFAVLAKASSLAGAIFAGAYAGVAAWALSERGVLRAADANLAPAVVGALGGLALVGCGLLLERACRVPKGPDDEDQDRTDGGRPSNQDR